MPSYVFKCQSCPLKLHLIRSIQAKEAKPSCTNCGTVMIRDYDPPAVTFIGIGWGKDG